jgi:hypothetical protein
VVVAIENELCFVSSGTGELGSLMCRQKHIIGMCTVSFSFLLSQAGSAITIAMMNIWQEMISRSLAQ